MSIIRKIEVDDSTFNFTQQLENTLFHLLDDDDAINIYMLTHICKLLGLDATSHFPDKYCSGAYQLNKISGHNFEMALSITEALYETCILFQRFDLALIVNAEVTRNMIDTGLALNWVDGKFYDKN
ncbi:hypothetical protein [Mucilaginibacter polytrichastri]|nr:hypothetical protein [Mucilaginibacter polytrichastri]SFT11869.1 hypothetical protein SAMN04487890_11199 [Mucilaginibacter polytrichastri]